jgi:hypothetical protein
MPGRAAPLWKVSRWRASPDARIPDDTRRHQPVPDEQDRDRSHGRGDEAGTLIRTVPADGLADERRQKRARNV